MEEMLSHKNFEYLKKRIVLTSNMIIKQILKKLNENNQECAAILDAETGKLKAGTSLKDILLYLGTNRITLEDGIEKAMVLRIRTCERTVALDWLIHAVETNQYVILKDDPRIVITFSDVSRFVQNIYL